MHWFDYMLWLYFFREKPHGVEWCGFFFQSRTGNCLLVLLAKLVKRALLLGRFHAGRLSILPLMIRRPVRQSIRPHSCLGARPLFGEGSRNFLIVVDCRTIFGNIFPAMLVSSSFNKQVSIYKKQLMDFFI